MNLKIKKAYAWTKNEIKTHPLSYMYVAGVAAGAVSYHVGMTWKRDLLILTRNAQTTLMEGAQDAIKYQTKRGAFYLLPERIFTK